MSLFNFFQKKEYSIGIVPGKETQKMLDKRDDETIYLFLKYFQFRRAENAHNDLLLKDKPMVFLLKQLYVKPMYHL